MTDGATGAPPAVHETQDAAIDHARQLLEQDGGGEVIIHEGTVRSAISGRFLRLAIQTPLGADYLTAGDVASLSQTSHERPASEPSIGSEAGLVKEREASLTSEKAARDRA